MCAQATRAVVRVRRHAAAAARHRLTGALVTPETQICSTVETKEVATAGAGATPEVAIPWEGGQEQTAEAGIAAAGIRAAGAMGQM